MRFSKKWDLTSNAFFGVKESTDIKVDWIEVVGIELKIPKHPLKVKIGPLVLSNRKSLGAKNRVGRLELYSIFWAKWVTEKQFFFSI